jgi:hypothetical protein
MNLNRREFFLSSAGATLAPFAARSLAQPGPAASTAPSPGRPLDILILLTDQWNPYNVGYERDPDVHTPHLDALAAQSVNFTRCYSNSPVCMPARTSLNTGLFPHNTGLWGNATDGYVRPDTMPMFSDIRRTGYTTSPVGFAATSACATVNGVTVSCAGTLPSTRSPSANVTVSPGLNVN